MSFITHVHIGNNLKQIKLKIKINIVSQSILTIIALFPKKKMKINIGAMTLFQMQTSVL